MKDQNSVILNWKGNHEQPLVSILCDAFNHEKFIRETLEGFLN